MYTLVSDFGVVVLIWMVQLIIYPGLLYYNENDLNKWHDKYTTLMSYVVLPLMILQLLLHCYDFWTHRDLINAIMLALVGAVWIITLTMAVPLHGNVASKKYIRQSLEKLIGVNWYRTVLWTLVFILNVLFQEHIIR